ncbi:MAG: hypothetical protein EHM23_28145 [Acidobacteria bacterium]|nr:MAG: hypothetical protein EHM23_28145 [Acidobacteriota bacterium]
MLERTSSRFLVSGPRQRTRMRLEVLKAVSLGALVFTLLSLSASAQVLLDWNAQADKWRGRNGERLVVTCPGGGTLASRLWGTGTYTDDSSICTAAVHAGLITAAQGGTVIIEIAPGATSYEGSARHGVNSSAYGAWHGSFRFVSGGSAPGKGAEGGGQGLVQTSDWATQANGWRGQNNQRFTLACPGGGSISNRLWGTDIYTDDSSICTAAVHAGLISASRGGTVTIEIRPGSSSYQGSARNGVSSRDYGAWSGSFVFVRGSTGNDSGPTQTADWATQADGWRGQNNRQFTLSCPAGGSISNRLWGTDTYTDDSSICTAAVHAGLISAARGGTVTIEIRPGLSSYQGSARNGVSSRDYGAWSGSFVFLLR